MRERQAMIDPKSSEISIREQCVALGISRSGYYHNPASESTLNLRLMTELDVERQVELTHAVK